MSTILEEPKSSRPQRLTEDDWSELLKQIKKGKCTPFIGPGVCRGLYPSKPVRSQAWAEEEDYPLEDRSELARVAQFLAVRDKEATPINKLVEEFEKNDRCPDLTNPLEPHRVLSDLPLPVYITTNYDHFMIDALKFKNREPKQEYCHWRRRMHGVKDVLAGIKPTVANPVLFHLYGHTEVKESLVLTENDFLKFLVNITREHERIPPVIQGIIADGSLLFLGYRLDEWDFRILLHTLATFLSSSLARAHISVQLVPIGDTATPEQIEKATKFLNLYFEKLDTKVYWGSCQEFVEELSERWKESGYGN